MRTSSRSARRDARGDLDLLLLGLAAGLVLIVAGVLAADDETEGDDDGDE